MPGRVNPIDIDELLVIMKTSEIKYDDPGKKKAKLARSLTFISAVLLAAMTAIALIALAN